MAKTSSSRAKTTLKLFVPPPPFRRGKTSLPPHLPFCSPPPPLLFPVIYDQSTTGPSNVETAQTLFFLKVTPPNNLFSRISTHGIGHMCFEIGKTILCLKKAVACMCGRSYMDINKDRLPTFLYSMYGRTMARHSTRAPVAVCWA